MADPVRHAIHERNTPIGVSKEIVVRGSCTIKLPRCINLPICKQVGKKGSLSHGMRFLRIEPQEHVSQHSSYESATLGPSDKSPSTEPSPAYVDSPDESNLLAMASNLLAIATNLLAMASNLLAMASSLLAMASNLLAMASNLLAMASNYDSNGLQPTSNGL